MSKVHAVEVNLHQHQGYPLHAQHIVQVQLCTSVSGFKAATPPRGAQQSHGPLHSLQNTSSWWNKLHSLQKFLKIILLKCISIFNKSTSTRLLQCTIQNNRLTWIIAHKEKKKKSPLLEIIMNKHSVISSAIINITSLITKVTLAIVAIGQHIKAHN